MEFFGFMVLLLVALIAMSSSSSDRDERRPPRDRFRDDRRRASNRYARDEDDAYNYPYYPNPYWPSPYGPHGDPYSQRPQGAGFIALVRAFFAGVVAISAVAAGVYYKFSMDSSPPKPPTTEAGINGAVGKTKEEPVKITAPAKEYEPQKMPHMVCLKKTDYVTYRSIQKIYPKRKIEAYLDKNDRYWICIFAMTSEELDETVALLRYRKDDLDEHGLELIYYKTSDLCSGKLVREKGTDIWFCQE